MITKEEKIKIITDRIEQADIHISWLNTNIGKLEEIPSDKLTMQQQLDNFILKKAVLQALLEEESLD